MQKKIFIFLLAIAIVENCKGQIKDSSAAIFSQLQKSYVDANSPDKDKFDRLIKRDLEHYFSGIYGHTVLSTEFLRIGPTQNGVAYPKYYLWVKIYKANKLVNQGAARIEAIEKKRFEVTDFVSITEIRNNSKDIYSIFPFLVCEKIKSRL